MMVTLPDIPEYACVRAVKEIRDDEVVIPVGATGTVVCIIKNNFGYEVEFTEPIHVVVGVYRDEIALIEGAHGNCV